MLKLMNKKQVKMLSIILVLLISVVNSGGCGCGKDETPSETRIMPAAEESVKVDDMVEIREEEQQQKEPESTKETNPSEDPHGDEGGNQYSNDSQEKVFEINVLVSENEYYYDNAPISLEELEIIINEVEGEKIVMISNNKASQSAYKKLTDSLDKNGVPYAEQ